MPKYHTLQEVADDRGYEVDRLLVHGITGELEICLLAYEPRILKEIELEVKPELIGKIGHYPIPRDNIHKIRNTPFFHLPGESGRPNQTEICANLVVTHKEKIRFENKHIPKKESVPKTEMGTRERENLLRLIGALIKKYYKGNRYRKADGSPNADTISAEFHDWLTDNKFTDTGMSARHLAKIIPKAAQQLADIIPEADDLFMQNKK